MCGVVAQLLVNADLPSWHYVSDRCCRMLAALGRSVIRFSTLHPRSAFGLPPAAAPGARRPGPMIDFVAKDHVLHTGLPMVSGSCALLTPWYVPINHCCRFPMARSTSGTTDWAPRCSVDRRGWIRGCASHPLRRSGRRGDTRRCRPSIPARRAVGETLGPWWLSGRKGQPFGAAPRPSRAFPPPPGRGQCGGSGLMASCCWWWPNKSRPELLRWTVRRPERDMNSCRT